MRTEVDYFIDEYLRPFEVKCRELFDLASGLLSAAPQRAERKFLKTTLDSVQTSRCKLWERVQEQMAHVTGVTLYEVFTEAALAMEGAGFVKPEVNAAMEVVEIVATDGGEVIADDGVVDAASEPATAIATESLSAPAASGLELFNHEKSLSLLKNSFKARELRAVIAINVEKFACKPAALCADFMADWETFAPKVATLVRIGLCASSAAHAKLWAGDLPSIDPETVNAVTLERLSKFSAAMSHARKKYMLQKFRAFMAAKEEWRKRRIQSDCVEFATVVVELFVSGKCAAIPLDRFAAVAVKLDAFLADDESRRSFVEFVHGFLAAAKAVQRCPPASSPQDLLHDARALVAAALAACEAVLEKWPLADSQGHATELHAALVTPDLREALELHVKQYTQNLQDA